MNLSRIKLLSLFFYFFYTQNISAQSGWDFIKQNDHKKAITIFKSDLEKDSTNINALKGMIFLSETSGDERSYTQYINTLVKNHWDENYFLLFEKEITGDVKPLLEKNTISERLKIEQKLHKADELYKKRKIDESYVQYGEVFGNYNWTFIGPFKNTNGSGHITKFPIESESYDTTKIYTDEDGDEMKWVDPSHRNRKSMVSFKNNLKYSYSTTVYFANTFIEVSEKKKVQFRITRGSPMKIWVDDYLVFDNNDNISYEWDNEIIELDLNEGVHRILVKCSDLNKRKSSSYSDFGSTALKGNYDEYSNQSFNDYSNFKFNFRDNHYSGNFEIRLTDQEGKLLKNVKSYSKANYSPAKYSPELKGLFVINYIKAKIKQEPENYFNYFALLKAYKKYEFELRGEESLIKFYRENKDLVLAKYLAYSIYFVNGKREKAYEVLNDIDHSKTPIFNILFQKLEEIDDVNDEENYIEALDNLRSISPSNFDVIGKYIDYYDKKDMTEEKEEYIKKMIKEYPDYEYKLKSELKKNLDEKKKLQKEALKNRDDYSYKKNIKDLKKDVRQSFYPRDYFALIKHYQARDEVEKTMALYDELLKIEPYEADHYLKKADFLFEQEKFELALGELNKVLKLRPFEPKCYELMGDIYYEKKEKEKALHYYRISKKLSGKNGSSYHSKGSINEKIEKIEGQKQLKKIFQTASFQDILAKESEWKEKYKDEESVVLMYTRDVVIDSTNHGEAFDKIMIKILNDGGIKKWLEYDFSFLGTIKSAKIIKKSGAEVIPEGSGGYKVFKNLEPGDIIQIEGGFQFDVTNGIEESNYFHTYMSFEAPVYYTKFEVAVSEGKFLGYLHHKLEDNLKKTKDKGYDYYKWEYYGMPKIANEDASIDKFDYYSSIMISTVPDWTKIASWYDRITYRKLESNYEVKEILDTIIKPGMTDREKVEKIYNFLTREIKYSFVPFLQSGYVPKDPGLTVCSRIGDCKDVATLMITMLREVGIESYYVLVKTNDYFHEKMLPSIYFNHVVAGYYLDGKLHYSDMTTDFYPYYILPEMDANAWALLIKENGGELFQLPKDNIDANKNKTEISVNAKFNLDRSADLKVNATHMGITGGNIREKFAQSNKEEQKNYIMDIMGKGIFDNVELTNYQFHNIPDISHPLKSDYTFNIFNYCDRVSSMLVFRIPYMTPITAHPAILSKTRYNSLDLGDVVNIEPTVQKMTLEFPEGYELLEMPKDISVESKYGTYKVTFKKIKNGLYVEKFQTFNYAVIDVKEFEAFKKFYLELLDIDSSKIALKK